MPAPSTAPNRAAGDRTWPGPETTGPTDPSALVSSGSITTSRDGQVIKDVEVTGSITVQHDNVTIRNVRVRGTGLYGIQVPSSLHTQVTGLLIEDVEIFGVSGSRSAGIAHYGQWTARRVEIHRFTDLVKMLGGQTLADSWLHDPLITALSHNDGVQSVGTARGSTLSGNNIDMPYDTTSAILLQAKNGPVSGWMIDGNRFAGGGYTVRLYGTSSMQVSDNVFVRGSWNFGPYVTDGTSDVLWSGNTYDDGTPLRPG